MPTHTFPLQGPINLQVRIGHGSVTVDTQDDLAEASVRLEAGEHGADALEQTTAELNGNTLTVNSPRQGGIFDLPVFAGRRSTHGVDVHIVIPSGTAVKISTFTAPIEVVGRVGGADIAFGSGEASLREVDGDLRLRFGSGQARAIQVNGSVTVRSGHGDAQFGEIGGALTSGSGGGNLRVRVARGPIRSRCGSGTVQVDEVHGDVDVASGSGALALGLPSGVTARLDVHTGSGQVRSELPIEDKPTSTKHAITLRARTGSGDVRLFRAA
jgi:Putative adhesin